MLCPKCGYYSEKEEIVCPECGEVLTIGGAQKQEGAQAIRQGKRAREAALRQPAAAPEPRRRRRNASRTAESVTGAIPASEIREGTQPEAAPAAEPEAEEASEPEGFDRLYRPVYDESNLQEEEAERAAQRYEQKPHRSIRGINWVKMLFVSAAALILVLAGGWAFLRYTDMGQRVLVRLGQKANSTALWAVGEERLD